MNKINIKFKRKLSHNTYCSHLDPMHLVHSISLVILTLFYALLEILFRILLKEKLLLISIKIRLDI